MSFKIKEVSAIRIFSNDIKKSRDFYAALFAQEPIEDLESFVSFKIGGSCFDITMPDSKNPHSQGGSVGYWLVDNIDAVLKKVEGLGGKLYRGPLNVPETQRTIMQIQDPTGSVIGFEALL
ncbi:VOC family protein [Bdellovibrio sp. HCB290]|uniref:VOC family protein n=1 Tax=Bdellovibrio sp. HCB290 TaxID=3394356 RepID=UPI0039B3AEDC